MMTVRLIAHTPEPEKVVAAAAKLCYSDAHITDLLDGLDEEKTARFLTMLSDLGHASPIEHASFTFGIEGVSRTLLAQITRHRIASFSVQSQRYVRLDDFRYVIPPEIEAIPEAKAAFIESMNEDARRYLDLVQKLEDGHTARLMAEGLPEKQARAKASKQANEDARFVLPNACETKMVVTMNARSLQNFFHLRCCSRAQWEIRQLAEEMLRLVYPVAPHIFRTAGPACVSGPCPEGKMCCGKTAEVRAKYAAIKELTQENISYTSDKGKTYDFNTADKLNALLIKALVSTGELTPSIRCCMPAYIMYRKPHPCLLIWLSDST